MKGLWNKFYHKVGDPLFAQKAHGWFTIIWFFVSLPLVVLFGTLVLFVSWLSVYAIVTGHWAAWQAARTEVAQSEADRALRELVERLRKLDPDDPNKDAERK